MPSTGASPDYANLPATCQVRGWRVFVNGFHKSGLYSPADIDRMVSNFAMLSASDAKIRGADNGPFLEPNVKLGHNSEQRAKESLGFPSFGRVSQVERDPEDGWLVMGLDDVPTRVGAWINGRLLKRGSIEIKPQRPDPRDPAKVIDGPILEGVALLGEEQPAVPGGGPPIAVFADGTPVPPDTDPAPLLAALGAAQTFSANHGGSISGRGAPCHVLAFSSEVSTMTPEEIKAQLVGEYGLPEDTLPTDPAKLQALWNSMETGEKFAGQMKKKFGATTPEIPSGTNPPPPPVAKPDEAMAAMAKKFAEMEEANKAMTARMGALEAVATEEKKKGTEAQMAAFSDRVETVIKANGKRIPPALRPHFREAGIAIATTKKFGAVADDTDKAFAAWKESIEKMPESVMFSDALPDPVPGTPQALEGRIVEAMSQTPLGKKTLRQMQERAAKATVK